MQANDTIYHRLFAEAGSYIEHRITLNNETTYGEDFLVSISLTSNTFSSTDDIPTSGNCVSSQLDLTMRSIVSANIPRSAKIYLEYRVKTASETSGWFPGGTYYISTRDTDSDGLLTIKAYDSMMKCDRPMNENGEEGAWNYTDIQVVNTIASAIGVTVNAETTNTMVKGYSIPYPGMGDDSLTMREVLGYIGSMYCGNFTINKNNEVELRQLNRSYMGSFSNYAITASNTDYYSLGAAKTAFTKVELYDDNNTVTKGTDTGSVFYVYCPFLPSDSTERDTLCQNILNVISGYSYQPYEITGHRGNPALELGDTIIFPDNTISYAFQINSEFGMLYSMDLTAETDEQTDDEYPYESKSDRVQSRTTHAIEEVITSLTMMNGEITGVVSAQLKTYRGDSDPYGAVSAWQANHNYAVGDHVGYSGSSYECIEAHTSGTTFDTSKWTAYNQIKTGDLWYCTSDNDPLYTINTWYRSSMLGLWASNVTYPAGAKVIYQNIAYECTEQHTSELPPPNDETHWGTYPRTYIWEVTTQDISVAPEWAANTDYVVTDIVTYEGKWYSPKQNHKSGETFEPEKWNEREYISEATQSQITQTMNSITLAVNNNSEGSSSISLTSGETTITSPAIQLTADTVKVSSLLVSPTIQAGVFKTDATASSLYSKMVSTGMILAQGASSAEEEDETLMSFGISNDTNPEIVLGAGTGATGTKGLIKKFSDGVWFGNSIPESQTGSFTATEGCSGIFIDTDYKTAYVIEDTEWKELFTGNTVAVFG